MKVILYLTLILFAQFSYSQTISVYSSYESAGIKITLPSGYDADKTSRTIVEYKETATSTWLQGFPLDRITTQSVDQFRGSLFGLKESTNYTLRIVLVDSLPTIDSDTLATFTFTTLLSPTFNPSTNIKWVSPSGSGTTYSESNPGILKVLLSSGTVTCGTTIYCKDGIYSDFDMGFNISTSCTEGTPIQLLAAPGAHPIFDGAQPTTLSWTQSTSDPNLYSASLPTGTDYTNICHINGQLLYPYPTLTANTLMGGYNLSNLSFGADGFCRDASVIWLKTQAGLNPNLATVKISRAFRWLTIYGNNHNLFLKIKGITVRNYGKSNVSGASSFTGMAADFRLVNHVTFDSCTFFANNADIRFDGTCNTILVQNCTFENNNGLATHGMVKKSNDETILIPTSMARTIETSAIQVFTTKGLTMRNNLFKGTNSGIVSSFQTGFVEEVDIYNNIFENNFDGVECDGFWSNLRVWKNEFISPMAAFSIAPPKIGPRYFYRNVIHHLKGRRNVQDDPYFIGCTAPTVYWQAGIGIKTNSGPVVGDSANLYFFNNTFHSEDSLGFAFTMWDSEWKSARFVNNILYDKTKHVAYFHDLGNKPNYQMAWDHNNFFVDVVGQPIMVAKQQHGLYVCHSIMNINQLQSQLNSISGSSEFSFTNSLNANPNFVNTITGGFLLNTGSAMIDAGIPIKGFYDYAGLSPDLGAKETPSSIGLNELSENEDVLVFPNPNAGHFYLRSKVDFDDAFVQIFSANGTLVGQYENLDGYEVEIDAPLTSGIYFIHLHRADVKSVKKMVIR